jgi:Predicted metal-dependent phosphoesterases (PHP family)
MHVHTKNVSSCAKVGATELVYLYKAAGYQAVIITDHFFDGFFENLTGLTWAEKIDDFMSGYREARMVGSKTGLKVFMGMEIRFSNDVNDYLVYGMDESFLKARPFLYNLNLMQFHELIQDKDILIYQAHPFRPGIKAADPGFLDGVEVFNGNMRHNSKNDLAYEFAMKNQLRMISGSDFHQRDDLGRGGIITLNDINSNEELVAVLSANNGIKLLGVEKMVS